MCPLLCVYDKRKVKLKPFTMFCDCQSASWVPKMYEVFCIRGVLLNSCIEPIMEFLECLQTDDKPLPPWITWWMRSTLQQTLSLTFFIMNISGHILISYMITPSRIQLCLYAQFNLWWFFLLSYFACRKQTLHYSHLAGEMCLAMIMHSWLSFNWYAGYCINKVMMRKMCNHVIHAFSHDLLVSLAALSEVERKNALVELWFASRINWNFPICTNVCGTLVIWFNYTCILSEAFSLTIICYLNRGISIWLQYNLV